MRNLLFKTYGIRITLLKIAEWYLASPLQRIQKPKMNTTKYWFSRLNYLLMRTCLMSVRTENSTSKFITMNFLNTFLLRKEMLSISCWFSSKKFFKIVASGVILNNTSRIVKKIHAVQRPLSMRNIIDLLQQILRLKKILMQQECSIRSLISSLTAKDFLALMGNYLNGMTLCITVLTGETKTASKKVKRGKNLSLLNRSGSIKNSILPTTLTRL